MLYTAACAKSYRSAAATDYLLILLPHLSCQKVLKSVLKNLSARKIHRVVCPAVQSSYGIRALQAQGNQTFTGQKEWIPLIYSQLLLL